VKQKHQTYTCTLNLARELGCRTSGNY